MSSDLKTWDETTWPISRSDIDSIYFAIREAHMLMRLPVEVQTPSSRLIPQREVDGDWRLFGITWVWTEFLRTDSFRLLYDKGEHTEHRFAHRS